MNIIGTYAFVEFIPIPAALKGCIASAKVTATVDEHYKLTWNYQLIVQQGGDYFLDPISYDVTPYLIYDDNKKSILRLDATNTIYAGGLAWKFELTFNAAPFIPITLTCLSGQEFVNGVCLCKATYTLVSGVGCCQYVWVSTPNSLSANVVPSNSQLQTRQVRTVPIDGAWHSIPGATWIWDTMNIIGTYAFVEFISIPAALKGRIASAMVTATVDEHYKLMWNDQLIVQQGDDYFLDPISYDVTPYLIYDDNNKNILRFDVTNLSGPGGLAYKLELTLK